MALLFLLRRQEREAAPLSALLAALPSLIFSALFPKLAPPMEQWPPGITAAFIAAALLSIGALASLGRCFAVLPGVRGVAARGAYRLVRHPVYLAETLMLSVVLAANGSLLALWPVPPLVLLLAWRILAEERLLSTQPEYREYCRQVRWRLVPGVW